LQAIDGPNADGGWLHWREILFLAWPRFCQARYSRGDWKNCANPPKQAMFD
jgi:hypothetical protein